MTIFTKIINKEIPCNKIAENDLFIAFLDIEPIVRGHVLVVPKIEVDIVYNLDDKYLSQIMVFAKPIAKAIEQAFDCKRCGFSIIGLEVPHTHLHIVPINSANDLNFTRAKLNVSDLELNEDQAKIIKFLNQ